jgi:hypothetical protein
MTGPDLAGSPGAKVIAGFFSFTEITDPSRHREYNAWHQLDHLPEQIPLRGIAHGQRWVVTPRCKELTCARSESLARSHYLTIYLMIPPLDETLRDFYDLALDLHSRERFFAHRRAVVSGPLDVLSTRAARRVLISAAAVPYRPNRGLYVFVGERAATDPEALAAIPGVAGVWVYGSIESSDSVSSTPGDTVRPPRGAGETFDGDVTVCYLDDDPVVVAGSIGGSLGKAPGVSYAGPLETVTPWEWDWFDGSEATGE